MNAIINSVREFRPALRFLGLFTAIYIIGNVTYGLYVEGFNPGPDPMTVLVSKQSTATLNYFYGYVSSTPSVNEPIVRIERQGSTVLRVFEGCNGLNVMIVFIAFIVAFGGKANRMAMFVLAGLLLIHVANLMRIDLLFYTALSHPDYFYYFHKYFFTACLYVEVFIFWYLWIAYGNRRNKS